MRIPAKAWLVTILLPPLLGVAPGAASALTKPGPAAAQRPGDDRRIEEDRFVRIGGIEQWVTIRGDSRANPVILFLHGGPGNPLSPYADTIYAAWEKDFTLVQWDQRGAGRTYGRNPEPAELTVAGMAADGIELAEYLTGLFGQEKIILVGGSWGSVLGVHMARARPDLFHAYLGAGQLVEHKANLNASYRRIVDLARKADDETTLAAMAALGPPPWANPRHFGALRRATRVYEAKATKPAPAGWWAPAAAYATDAARAEYEAGEEFSYLQFVGWKGDGMLSKVDLPALGGAFPVPLFLVQGAQDLVTMPEVARAWFDSVSAPEKEYRLVDSAGHDPNAALIEAQYEILQSRIRPLGR